MFPLLSASWDSRLGTIIVNYVAVANAFASSTQAAFTSSFKTEISDIESVVAMSVSLAFVVAIVCPVHEFFFPRGWL